MFMRINIHPLLSLVLTLVACSSDPEATPPDTGRPVEDTGTDSEGDTTAPDTGDPSDGTGDPTDDVDSGPGPDDVVVPPDADTVGPDGVDPDVDPDGTVIDDTNVADVTDVDAGEQCFTDEGCYACIPIDEPTYLNACTDSSCAGFDNVDRLPLLNADGSLPPLP